MGLAPRRRRRPVGPVPRTGQGLERVPDRRDPLPVRL